MKRARILCSIHLDCDFGRTFESRRLEAFRKAKRVAVECYCMVSWAAVMHTVTFARLIRCRTCFHSQMSSCTHPSMLLQRCASGSCRSDGNCSCMDCVECHRRSDPSCTRSACTRSVQFDKYHGSIVESWQAMMHCDCWNCFDGAPIAVSTIRRRADISP